jgi:hypothetical protein
MKMFPILLLIVAISECAGYQPHRTKGPINIKWEPYVQVADKDKTAWGTEWCDKNGIKTKTAVLMDPKLWAIHTDGCLTIKD